MKKMLVFAIVILNVICTNAQDKNISEEITTYYLIRHAEKDRSDSNNQDPELNDSGMERAQKWSEVLKEVSFDAVYSTNYKRTIQTATPTAKANNLEIENYDPNQLFNKTFKEATKGKTVLVVGHSNTTPMFVNAILEENVYENIDDAQNGALFIVEILPGGMKSHKVLYFN